MTTLKSSFKVEKVHLYMHAPFIIIMDQRTTSSSYIEKEVYSFYEALLDIEYPCTHVHMSGYLFIFSIFNSLNFPNVIVFVVILKVTHAL